jgi:GNAT superfamily N-acetyltransferase
MRWNEISKQEVDEHKKISALKSWTLTDELKDLSLATLVGKIGTDVGVLDIYEEFEDELVAYRVVENNQVIGFRTIEQRSDGYAQGKNFYLLPEYRKKGIMSALLLWILDNRSYKIISDYRMTDDGEKTWISMMAHKKLYVVDITTGDKEIWTNDGKNTMDPRTNNDFSDNRNPEDPKDPNRKKIFWLLEGFNLLESKDFKIRSGLSKFSLPYKYFEDGSF